jgi:adenine-specific DNA-methyltransferase
MNTALKEQKMTIEKLDPKKDGASPDIVAENIARMRELFPEVFTEGKIDFEILRETLGDYVEDKHERYSFTWYGKSNARRIAQTPSAGTLLPCPEESVDWDTTKNIFIEGDNLEVLKLLQKSYHRKVKMIYIDPPYNRGKEIIYPDKYQDNLQTYLKYTKQVDEEGFKISANSDTSGRYHTNWLNMMYPRLKLARNLLRDDGIIFVSIDEVEYSNLKRLLDEVFGDENFLGTVVWKNATDNNPSQIATEHEYLVGYSREKATLAPAWRSSLSDIKNLLVSVGKELLKKYKSQSELQKAYTKWFREHKTQLWPMDRYKYIDQGGIYTGSQSVHNPGKEGYRYDILHPVTGKPCKQPLMGYRFPSETMDQLLTEGRIIFGKDHTKIIELKVYAHEFMDKLSSVITLDGRLGAYDLRKLFPEIPKLFTNPKPVRLIIELLSFSLEDDDIALDFFAGSCSVAEAVLQLNANDLGRRRFIMVQLPEPVDPSTDIGEHASSIGLKTIAKIGAERIRRAGNAVRSDVKDNTKEMDAGFRVFKLASSNLTPWDPNTDTLEQSLFNAVENIKPDRTEEDLLYEILLKYGLDLAIPIECRTLNGKKIHIIGAGALVVCLAKGVTLDVVEGIAALKKELSPEVMRVVFRDAGFADDVVKTNAIQILKQAGITDVKSL